MSDDTQSNFDEPNCPAWREWDRTIVERHPNAQPPPIERRARKALVEHLLTHKNWAVTAVAKHVAERFKVSTRAVLNDVVQIERRWLKHDEKYAQKARTRVVRRLEELWERAWKDEKLMLCLQINKEIARVLGITDKGIEVNVGRDHARREAVLRDPNARKAIQDALDADADATESP